MRETSLDDHVTVHLVGGPPCWDGLAIEGVYDHEEIYEVPVGDLGALLRAPSAPRPPQAKGAHEVRAVYEPLPGGNRNVWHFKGWE
ncbi:hypothetical protein PWG71_03785 [Nocardiopsis sp. N85]|uniref:hypothetical protein n=1 Tax=Nocardiopsis sp. N85 TaxID=3029400 RepID=UPI00237FC122|nr:hypothetical protein [Nocardiopsis sp. N85]MDE3720496.1 hypothetical protein [Nocardiopsis sp. N85]